MRKAVYILSTLLIIAICFCACFYEPFKYSGSYADLYTEALHSILGIAGRIEYEHGVLNPVIEVVDQDEYGRKLFLYNEEGIMKGVVFLLISQKTENDTVYYYPDYNFLIVAEEDLSRVHSEEKEKDVQQSWWESDVFSDQIAELKAINDWNKEIRLERCVSQKIILDKENDPLPSKRRLKIYEEIFGEYKNYGDAYIQFLTKDDDGKLLYLAENTNRELDDYRMLIVDGDAYYSKEINNLTAYQEELAAFKREHNWKKS